MAKSAYTLKAYKHLRLKWVVRSKISGKWERRFFETKGDAQTYIGQKEIELLNQGREGAQFPTWLRTMAQRSQDRLQPHGKTIADATEFYVKYLETTQKSVLLSTAIEELVETKTKAGRSKRYCSDLKTRLTRLNTAFQKKSIGDLTTADLDAFLSDLKVAPGTVNTFRRDIRTLWSFADKRGWTRARIAKNTELATASVSPPGILTPEQAAKLVANSTDHELLAFVCIGLFGGLRVAEIKKLDWSDVDLKSGYINVSAENSKTRSRRLVPIVPNLAAWLRTIPQKKGRIVTREIRHAWDLARIGAGFGPFFSINKIVKAAQVDKNDQPRKDLIPWPDNGMRHSFVSYRLADTGNAAQTALESGHDQAVLFRHYRELVRPNAAKKYFSIRPVGKKKVIDLSEAA